MPASDRLSRARQLRNKQHQQQRGGGGGGAKTTATSKKATTATSRSGGGGRSVSSPSKNNKNKKSGSSNDDDETSVDMSASSTIACIFLLLSIGASLATSYIMIHNPGCMAVGDGTGGGNAPVSTPVTGNIRTPATSGTVVAPPAPKPVPATTTAEAAQPGSKPGFPPKCTTDQKKAVMKQLPADDCYGQPYTQHCSFNRGTTRGCKDNFWVRDTYSSTSFDKFTAILVNNGCKRSIEFADIMLMGSHDEKKYGTVYGYNKFVGRTVTSCQKPISQQVNPNVHLSQAICITPTDIDQTDIRTGKQAVGITGDTEIKEMVSSVGRDVKKLDDIIYKEIGLTKEQPIHYLLIRDDDNDILMGSMEVLDQVRYLEFDNNWKGSWGSNPQPNFSDMIQKVLLDKNFVCYWNGVDLNLWRITDCWLSHYAQQWWSRVACVNIGHADAKPLLDKMESMFQETLMKDQKYGGP